LPLITDGRIQDGFFRKRRILSLILPESNLSGKTIPKMAYSYAKKMANLTGLSIDEVLESKPVRSYIDKLEERVSLD
jgi:hypothetical protein